jgi:hypothetical protein
MNKNKTSRLQRRKSSVRRNRRAYTLVGVVCAILLLAFGTIAGPWSPFPGSRIRTAFLSPQPLPSPANPSKEYIYAGSKLIATEEPSLLAAPTSVVAATFSNARIDISWTAPATAPHHYVVERATQLGNFATLNSNVTGTTYSDTTVTNLTAYLYRIRSADAGGNVSAVSNIDLATAITFEDDPFPAPPTQTLVRAQHVLQLRQAINAVRHLTPTLQDYDWDQDFLTVNVTVIKAIDVEELRTALDEALLILGMPTGGYTDSSLLGKPFDKQYIKELRDRVK